MEHSNDTPIPPPTTEPSGFLPTAHYSFGMRKAYPSVGGAFGLLGIMLGISAFTGLITGIVVTFNSHFVSFSYFIAYLAALGITLGLGIMFRRSAAFSLKLGSPLLWFLMLLFTLVFIVLREPMFHILPRWTDFYQPFMRSESLGFFYIVSVVIAAPVLEEFVFRGIILDGFLRRFGPLRAIMLSSLIFGIAHLQPLSVINAFMIGLLIGWIYWKTRSLLLSIFIHFVNNLAAVLLDYFGRSGNMVSTRQILGNDWLYAGFYIGCMIIGGFILLTVWFHFRRPAGTAI